MPLIPYNITIGSDPEFVIFCKDEIVQARDVLFDILSKYYCRDCSTCTVQSLCDKKDILLPDFNDKDKVMNVITEAFNNTYPRVFVTPNLINKDILIRGIYDILIEDKFKTPEMLQNSILRDNIDLLFDSVRFEVLGVVENEFIDYYFTTYSENRPTTNQKIEDAIREYYSIIVNLSDEIYRLLPKTLCKESAQATCIETFKKHSLKLEIGCDTQSAIGELRPKYFNDPLSHFRYVNHLIRTLFDAFNKYGFCDETNIFQIRAGTCHKDLCIGGHIHFGIKHIIDSMSPMPERVYDTIIVGLDAWLSHYAGTLLRRIEHPQGSSQRTIMGYGIPGGFRPQPYGIEWRMPASWLVSPEIAKAAICLSYIIVYEYIDLILNVSISDIVSYRIQNINLPDRIPPIVEGSEGFVTSSLYIYKSMSKFSNEYYHDYILINRMTACIVYNIISDIKNMKLYSTYFNEIEPLLSMVLNGEIWDDNQNIFINWIKPR